MLSDAVQSGSGGGTQADRDRDRLVIIKVHRWQRRTRPQPVPAGEARARFDAVVECALGIGRRHAGTPVLILVATTTVTVISKTTYTPIADHHINSDRNYWPNQQKPRPKGRGFL